MRDNETLQELTMEDRLKAIAYQFISLYERWSEDRQLAAQQGVDTAKLVNLFTEQVKNFKTLEPTVRQHLVVSIQNTTSSVAKKIGEEIGKEASRVTEQVAHQLAQVSEKTKRTLTQYEGEIIATQWKVISISVFTTIVTCLLLVWLLIPKPTFPLNNKQIKYLNSGMMMELVWPKLSKKEQQHWLELANQIEHSSFNEIGSNN
jgi:hypothetical protein